MWTWMSFSCWIKMSTSFCELRTTVKAGRTRKLPLRIRLGQHRARVTSQRERSAVTLAQEATSTIQSMIQRITPISKNMALSKDPKKGPHQIKVVRAANQLVTISSKIVVLKQTQMRSSTIANQACWICVKVTR